MRYEDVDWDKASCAGINTELFFMEANPAEAAVMTPSLRKVCAGCEILSECREYATANEPWGFWGGMTLTERALLRRRMRRAKHAA